ncbi:MAG TPA: hypothetical protein VF543_22260 [Pyrinomonadaceae bacterium]|jgi:hypothetical protein
MRKSLMAKRTHRASSKPQPRRILDKLAECLRLIALTVSIAIGIYGIYSNPDDSNVTEIVRLVLVQGPQVLRSVKRLCR